MTLSSGASVATAACMLCGATAKAQLHQIGAWRILVCRPCGLAHIDPWPETGSRPGFYAAPAIAARKAAKRRGPLKRLAAFARHWLRRLSGRSKGSIFLRELRRRVPRGARVLDIGCGTGAFLTAARTLYTCTGVELSEDLARSARSLGTEVLVGDFTALDFGPRRFDAIVMVSLIEHLHAPLAGLARCHALLEDGGMLLLKTVNHGGLNRRLLGAGWSGYRPPDHLVYFDRHTLARALREAGFEEITFSTPWFNDSFYCRAVRQKKGRP